MNDKIKARLWRWTPWVLAAVAAIALGLWAFSPQPLIVEVAPITRGRFELLVQEDGQLRLKNRFVITAPMQAELLRPTLQVGDSVAPGQVVAVLVPVSPPMIDPRNRLVLQQRVGRDAAAGQAALAQLHRLNTAFEQAQGEAQRAAQLAQNDFLSAAALEQAMLAQRAAAQALDAGRAQLRAAEFTLSESQAALARTSPSAPSTQAWRIQSPVKGQVVKLHQSSAGPVIIGQPLLDIGDLSAMEAVIDVLSSDAPSVQPGAPVQLSMDDKLWNLSGKVSRIEPVAFTKVSALGIEEQRVNVLVDLSPAPTQKAGDGFRVNARIRLFSADHALLVPSAALVRDGQHWRVMVLHNGHARARRIQIQKRHADSAWLDEKNTPLREGEPVILYPGSLQDGQAVQARTAPAFRP